MDPGQYTYPFQIYLPEWLPESCHLQMARDEQFFVEYLVRAQFTTQDKSDFLIDPRFPGKFTEISKFRGWRRFFVYAPQNKPHHQIYFEKKITHKAGGLMGIGSYSSETKITFKQN